MKTYCYINGKITEEKNAHIDIHDLGVLRGYGVLDFMCTAQGKPFHLSDHWSRLTRSAKDLGITLPLDKKTYQDIVHTLLRKNGFANTGIRTVLTGGVSPNGISLTQSPTFFIMMHDMDTLLPDQKLYKTGAKVITHPFARNPYISKTTNYIEAIKNQKKRNRKNAIEILYINNNTVLECATSNIFIVTNNTLITPHDDVLHGITRKIVLHLAQKNNIKAMERKITPKQLFAADEVFITGSAKHILPITKIDTQKVGNGKVGNFTKEISALYHTYLKNY